MSSIDFEVPHFESRHEIRQIVPIVDGVPIDQSIARFEKDRDFDVAGGYGGLVLDSFAFGDLRSYFLGAVDHRYFSKIGKIAVLACGDCGELGCWPLYSVVSVDDDSVTWSEFEQPHRRGRDYTGFGPFEFEREQYEAALEGLLARINRSER
jgi:hypothetical protein